MSHLLRWFVVGTLVLGALLVIPQSATAAATTSPDPNVPLEVSSKGAAAGKTLFLDDLTAPLSSWKNLSATEMIHFKRGYRSIAGPNPGDIADNLDDDAFVYYTKNGSQPRRDGLKITVKDAQTNVPEEARVYEGDWLVAELSNGIPPANTTIRFMVQVFKFSATNPPTDPAYCDMPGGNSLQGQCPLNALDSYAFKVDRSKPVVDRSASFPPVIPNALYQGVAWKDAVTANNRTTVTVRVQDVASETFLNPSTFKIFVDDVDKTTNFTVKTFEPALRRATFTWALAAADPKWGPNDHVVRVEGRDYARNPMNTTAAQDTFKFWIDQAKPAITDLSVDPERAVLVDGVPTSGYGVNVTIKATVTDEIAMNENGTNNVQAVLYNKTLNLISQPAFLKFNTTSKKWETKSLIIPATWPRTQLFKVHVRISAADMAGNVQTNETDGLFQLDRTNPVVTTLIFPRALSVGPYEVRVRVTDTISGVDSNKIILTMTNSTGNFTSNPTTAGWTKIDNKTFNKTMSQPTPGEFTALIPDANDGALVLYKVTASDQAGNKAITNTTTLHVDKTGPNMTELPRPGKTQAPAFRGGPPNTFQFAVLDFDGKGLPGAGVNPASGNLSYRVSGTSSYSKVGLTFANNVLSGNVSTPFDHGVTVQFFVEVRDLAGNLGTYGTNLNPKSYRVDRNPPSTTLSGPTGSDSGTFALAAQATDDLSGIDTITIEARPKPVGAQQTTWVRIFHGAPESTQGLGATKTFPVCLPGGTFEFRAYATDIGGTAATPPAAQVTTVVNGAGCPQTLSASFQYPASGSVLDAAAGTGKAQIKYSVVSSGTLTSPDLIRVTLEFSPDGGQYYAPLISKDRNTGAYNWSLLVPGCTQCRLKLSAEAPQVTNVTTVSAPFTILRGAPNTDLDGNAIYDQCELNPAYFIEARLGAAKAKDDRDRDGLNNADECRQGTNPSNPDTDGDQVSDGSEVRSGHNPLDPLDTPSAVDLRFEQFDATAWYVVGLFLLVTLVFALGITRKW